MLFINKSLIWIASPYNLYYDNSYDGCVFWGCMSNLVSDDEKTVLAPQGGSSLKKHLAISTALASVVLLGYGGRNAYAACTGAGGTYICTGNAASNPNTIALTGSPLNVTTTAGFGILTTAGAAFDLDGTDGLTFTDNFASDITGYTFGIDADNVTSGALSITTTGIVTGLNADGIEADNSSTGTDLTIDVAAVTGANNGVDAYNRGTGFQSITASGDVVGNSGDGIEADNSSTGTNLIIDVAKVTGSRFGIDAYNYGTGFLSITASGDVEGISRGGIEADNDTTGTNLTINVAKVTGANAGVDVYNRGTGFLSITASGDVEGNTLYGIDAELSSTGTDLTIDVAKVTGGGAGIHAVNQGSGFLSITSTGTVSGTTEVGIRADNGNTGTDLTISVASVTGGKDGILANNNGSGQLSITATGPVTGGVSGDGISVSAGADVTGVMINAVDVSGANYGIYVTNNSSNSPAAITVSGAVNGLSGGGIRNSTLFGTMSTITLNSGANVFGTNGTSILDRRGDTTVLVKSGAQVRGDVLLALGSDNLIFDGGTFGAGDILDGGDDTSSADGHVDKLTINGMTTTVLTGQIINWEQLAFVGSDFGITGDLATPELLSLTGGSILTVDGNFDGVTDGKLELDADLANDSASRLVVTGNTTGATTISVDAGSTGPATGNDITLVTVNGTKAAGDFVLDGNPIGAYVFDLALTGDDFALTNATLSPETPVFEAFPRILASLNGISNFNERFGERYFAATDSAALGYALMGYASTDAALETDSVQRNNAVWARIEGSHSKLASAQSTTSSEFDINQGKLQIGLDAMLADVEQGAFFVGVNASYGKARSDISSGFGNGKIDATGTAIGASLTWLASNGFYADGQAQFSWFNSDISSDALGQLESGNDGTGYVFGLEIGHRFENGNGVALTPQAQLIYSEVDFEDFTSAYGTSVTADETESLNLRVGMVVESGFSLVDEAGNGGFGNVQLIANVYHEFRNEMSVSVAGTPLANEADDWVGEIGIGGSFTNADGVYTVFGNASASSGLDNTFDGYALDGSAGVKIAF